MTRTVEHPVCAPCLCVLPTLTELNEFHGHSTPPPPTVPFSALPTPLPSSWKASIILSVSLSFIITNNCRWLNMPHNYYTHTHIDTHTGTRTYIYIYCHAHSAQMIKGFLTDRHQSEILLQFSIGLSWAAEGGSQE